MSPNILKPFLNVGSSKVQDWIIGTKGNLLMVKFHSTG